jgi:DivIVA domain-containing protein
MPEGRPTISSSRVSTGDISNHTFAIVRRGFDADEVKSYLQSVARSIEVLEQREQELRAAVAAADERAAHPVIDEATLTASLGQHSAQILRHAHEEAARIVVQAQEGASTLLREAQSQADEMQTRSEAGAAERVAEAELMVATTEQDARAEAERIRGAAMTEGEAIIGQAKDEGRALLEQVQVARKRVLADLASRRRALSIQIEQLRAARDEMVASINGARDSVDGILTNLGQTDETARAAAVAAGDEARLRAPGGVYDEESALAVPDEGGASSAADGPDDNGGTTPSVDELFARIRAGSDDPAQAPEAPATGGEAAPSETISEEAPPAGPDDALIVRRDELLSPVIIQLARHIKRALGDDQNRLLDVLRGAPSAQGDVLLGPEDLHLSTFATAAQGHLADAFGAGTVYAGGEAGGASPGTAVEQSAAGLARTVVTMLRRRIEEGTDSGEDVAERIGAAFREWRGERIERLVGDFAVQAFSAGVAAATAGGSVRWVLTSSNGCSDCDDNALAGAVPTASGFPTGHFYPPAHSGCRCLVAPTPG